MQFKAVANTEKLLCQPFGISTTYELMLVYNHLLVINNNLKVENNQQNLYNY